MSKKMENAINLYLEGIREGNVREAVTKYTGDRYTQHSTGVADGIEGFVAFFEPFIKRNPVRDIQIVLAVEDGQYVFVHAYQDINNGEAKWVTADLFDTDENDKIIEHWDVIQAYAEDIAPGRNLVDGPIEVEDLNKTDENKILVTNFCNDVLIGGQIDKVPDYISTEEFDQHTPPVEFSLEGYGKHLKEVMSSGMAPKYVKIQRIIGQGNFVVAFSHTQYAGEDFAYFDIFRVKHGKIVEQWNIQEMILPKEEWGNSGKF